MVTLSNENVKKEFSGGAVDTALASSISAGATSFTVVDGSTFPTGLTAPFVVALDRGTSFEEKLLCSGRSGNIFDVSVRGYDGSTAQSHAAGNTVAHVLDASTVAQANALASMPTGAGSLAVGSALNTWAHHAIPATDGLRLTYRAAATNKIEWDGARHCAAVKAAVQSVPHNTATVVTFPGTEDYDPHGMHSIVSNTGRITVDRSGVWLFDWSIYYTVTSATSVLSTWVDLTTSALRYGAVTVYPSGTVSAWLHGSVAMWLSSGVGAEVQMQFANVGSVAMDVGSATSGLESRFAGTYLGGD